MNYYLQPISVEKFKSKVKIQFSNILDGFNSFINFTLDGSLIDNAEDVLIDLFTRIFEENSKECYVDFYINNISEVDKSNLLNLLSSEDKDILQNLLKTTCNNSIYFKLSSTELIPFFVRLNTREVFFITFYFIKCPITIWGNYNLKFPCFFSNETEKNYYYNLFTSYNLVN